MQNSSVPNWNHLKVKGFILYHYKDFKFDIVLLLEIFLTYSSLRDLPKNVANTKLIYDFSFLAVMHMPFII